MNKPCAHTPLQNLLDALQSQIDPISETSYGKLKAITPQSVTLSDAHAHITVALPYPAQESWPSIQETLTQIACQVDGVERATVTCHTHIVAHSAGSNPHLSNVKNIIAVASGKGGVGKSTTAVNLALALQQSGARVGLLDADIYGPSQPTMLGIPNAQPESPDNKSMLPLMAHGLQVMSIGFLVDTEQAMVWRGPMVSQALQQLLNDTRWDNLDYLVIDLPPGTGDIQLTLAQKVPVSGAVIVTTPQDIALLDARKGLKMFEKVGVPVLGIVENMSMHICSQCGHSEAIFGHGGGSRMANDYHTELLAQLPLDMSIRVSVDDGIPTVVADPTGAIAVHYQHLAQRVAVKLALQNEDHRAKFPKIVIKNT